MALRGRLPGSTRLATGRPSSSSRLEGEIGELVVEQEAAHHAARTEGIFDAGGEGESIALVVDDGDLAGAAAFSRAIVAEGTLLHVRGRAGCDTRRSTVGIDQGAAFGKISRIEQAGDRHRDEVRVGEIARPVGESEPLGLGDQMRGARAKRRWAEMERLDDAEHLRHGDAAGGRWPHAANLMRAIGHADRLALDGAIARQILRGELARLARIALHGAAMSLAMSPA